MARRTRPERETTNLKLKLCQDSFTLFIGIISSLSAVVITDSALVKYGGYHFCNSGVENSLFS